MADCEALAAHLGWVVAERYVDNVVSAWSGRTRPQYRRMLDDIKNRVINGVVVWHPDRLHRHPRELEELIALVENVGNVRIETVTAGDFDLSTSAGRSIARIVGAIARKDSDDASVRLRRKHAELAAAGKLAGGGPRPFGYQDDRVTVNPEEAALIRQMAKRVLAGDSLRAVAVDLNEQGVRTTLDNDWDSSGVKRVLMSARISGRRERDGEFYPATWRKIITIEQSDRLRARLGARNRSSGRPPRRYLLTANLVRCGRCDTPMVARPTAHGVRRYVCSADPGQGGCGRMAALADPLEALIIEAVLYRLDTPQLAAAITQAREQQADLADLHNQEAADQAMLNELAADYATRTISRSEWMAAREPLQLRIDQARRRLSRLSPTTPIDPYVGHASRLQTAWADLALPRKQAVVRVLLDHIVVRPAPRGRGFNPDRFEPIWRL